MTDYEELVKALLSASTVSTAFEKLMRDAAAAIEGLQSEVRFWEAAVKGQEDGIKVLQNEVNRLKMHCADCEYGNSPWPEEQGHEPKRGKWIEENRRPRSSQFVCSECHRTAYDPQPTRDKAWEKRCRYAYCPNCGAKMEVQE